MPEMTKKQHYVPQFYLKRFADKDGYLHVYDKQDGKIFKSLPENICQQNYLYETEWENADKKLGKYVLQNSIEHSYSESEAEFAGLLSRLLKRCTPFQRETALICNSGEKKLLAEFVANLFVRHPCTMDAFQLDQIPDGVKEEPIFQAGQMLFSTLGLGSVDSLTIDAQKKAFMVNSPDGGFCADIVRRLCDLDFTFFYSMDSAFVTSSFPSGLSEYSYAVTSKLDEKLNVFLPLSPNVAVMFGNFKKLHSSRNRMIRFEKELVMEFNQQYMKRSVKQVRYIITQNEPLLQELIQRKESEG